MTWEKFAKYELAMVIAQFPGLKSNASKVAIQDVQSVRMGKYLSWAKESFCEKSI